jgi:hypothetical protein
MTLCTVSLFGHSLTKGPFIYLFIYLFIYTVKFHTSFGVSPI